MDGSLALLPPVLVVSGIALLIAAALHDLAARTIPNAMPAAIACIGMLLRLHDGTFLHAASIAVFVFSVAVILWLRRWMGGGDVKLLGAIALLLPPDRLLPAVMVIAIAGALLALPYIVLRGAARLRPPPARIACSSACSRAERHRLRRGGPLPYGVAIAIGTRARGSAGAGA